MTYEVVIMSLISYWERYIWRLGSHIPRIGHMPKHQKSAAVKGCAKKSCMLNLKTFSVWLLCSWDT